MGVLSWEREVIKTHPPNLYHPLSECLTKGAPPNSPHTHPLHTWAEDGRERECSCLVRKEWVFPERQGNELEGSHSDVRGCNFTPTTWTTAL